MPSSGHGRNPALGALSRISPSVVGRAQAAQQAIAVRVIEYALPGDAQTQPRYRLLTTLLDTKMTAALRSKAAELVRQEFYGWVLADYAARWLLHEGAARHRLPRAELSFKGHVELARRAQHRSEIFPPPEQPRRRCRWLRALPAASAQMRATRTTSRRSPRMVKRRNSRYAPHDRQAPTRILPSTPRRVPSRHALRPVAPQRLSSSVAPVVHHEHGGWLPPK